MRILSPSLNSIFLIMIDIDILSASNSHIFLLVLPSLEKAVHKLSLLSSPKKIPIPPLAFLLPLFMAEPSVKTFQVLAGIFFLLIF